MPASLHNSLILLASQVVHGLPAPLKRALDAWALRRARRRALQRQLQGQRKRNAKAPAVAAAYQLKPWRD